MDIQSVAFLNASHYEMAGWELIPYALAFLFITATLRHIASSKTKKSNRKKEFSEKRQTGDRKRLTLPMIVETPSTQVFSVMTYDISSGGAFIPMYEMQRSMNLTSLTGRRSGIKVGDNLNLKLQTSRFGHIHCEGLVVRLNLDNNGNYPGGIGIQFIKISRRDQRRLDDVLLGLPQQEVV